MQTPQLLLENKPDKFTPIKKGIRLGKRFSTAGIYGFLDPDYVFGENEENFVRFYVKRINSGVFRLRFANPTGSDFAYENGEYFQSDFYFTDRAGYEAAKTLAGWLLGHYGLSHKCCPFSNLCVPAEILLLKLEELVGMSFSQHHKIGFTAQNEEQRKAVEALVRKLEKAGDSLS